jgi:phosphatidylglycerol---prolipoprotein diacylglyceryl transferase
MVACAMLAAFFVLRADLERRGLAASSKKDAVKPAGALSSHSANAEAEMLIAIPCLAGLAGAKLYHLLESPAEFFAHPLTLLISPFGFAWFGGLLAGFAAFVWVGRRQHIPLLTLLDAGSPAAALGYGIGRIGCFLSGDGDYGIATSLPWGMSFPNGLVPTTERVHPTPIYELIVACAIAWFLWRVGARQIKPNFSGSNVFFSPAPKLSPGELDLARAKFDEWRKAQPELPFWRHLRLQWRAFLNWPVPGAVFAAYLVLTGLARFLVEFIRINPPSFLGMSNAQTASVASMVVGAALWLWLKKNRIPSSYP